MLLPTKRLGAIKMLAQKFGRAKQCLAPPKVSTNDGKWNLHILFYQQAITVLHKLPALNRV